MRNWARLKRKFGVGALAAVLLQVLTTQAGAQGAGGQQPSSPPSPTVADVCREAAKSLDAMRAAGIDGLIAKGPEWAKTSATKDELARIKQFMALQELVLFKCPVELPPPVTASGEPPPLPERRPVTARTRRLAPEVPGVPLPVQKRSVL